MAAWRLLARGLWWRRGLTSSVLAVAIVTTTAAALGPLYARAADESTLNAHLTAATWHAGLHASAVVDVGRPGAWARVQRAAPAAGQVRGYDRRIAGLRTANPVQAQLGSSNPQLITDLAWRTGECAHLVLVSGRCPSATGEALMSARTFVAGSDASIHLGRARWRLGSILTVSGFADPGFAGSPPSDTTVRIVGTYRPRDTADPFWFGQNYFDQHEGGLRTGTPPTVDTLFVSAPTLLAVPSPAFVDADLDYPLTASAIRLADEHDVRTAVTALTRRQGGDLTVQSDLIKVLNSAGRERRLVDVGTLLVTLQLGLLAWLVLFQIVADAVEARGTEIALSKLRGHSPLATIRFGLGEPVVLLAAAVPLGVLASWGAARVFADTVLVTGTPVVLTAAPVWAAVAAFAGGLVAAGLAGHRTLTRSVLDQWRRTTRHPTPGRFALAADVVVAVVAVIALVVLLGRPHITARTSGDVDGAPTALLAPGLLVLAVALVGVRLLPPLCRRLAVRTRGTRHLGLFLAVRQVARRATGLRLATLLAVAVGLATFAVAGETVASANRTARADAELGADRVARVQFDPDTDPVAATQRADPHGRWAMAAATWLPDGGGSVIGPVLGVDATRLPTIGYHAAGGPTAAGIAHVVGTAPVPTITVHTTALRVRLRVAELTGDTRPYLTVNLRTAHSPYYQVDGRPLADGANSIIVPVSCRAGCTLIGLTWNRSILATTRVSGTITLAGIDVLGGAGYRPLDLGLGIPASWRAAVPAGQASDRVTVGRSGVVDHFANHDGGYAGIDYAYVSSPIRAVATPRAIGAGLLHRPRLQLEDGLGFTADFRVVRAARVLPVVLGNGIVFDVRSLVNDLPGFADEASWVVWMSPDAPADALQRLRSAGLRVEGVSSVHHRITILSQQGPALALLLLLACAVAGAALAVGATAISISAGSRRRAYEVTALHVVGVGRRTLRRAAVLEQLLLLGTALVLGVPSGVAAALLAMPVIPEFADATPVALHFTPNAGPTLALVAGLVVLLGATATLAARALLRLAVPSRLREADG